MSAKRIKVIIIYELPQRNSIIVLHLCPAQLFFKKYFAFQCDVVQHTFSDSLWEFQMDFVIRSSSSFIILIFETDSLEKKRKFETGAME